MQLILGNRPVGDGHPVYIIGEIGINHNGDLAIAKQLINIAADAGCDAVKFQKRTPHLCVPPEQMKVMRDTPWGKMTYLQYRYKVEFERAEYDEIDRHCRSVGIAWFASPWDEPAVAFLEQYQLPCYKLASAGFRNDALIAALVATGKPLLASCGMSEPQDIANFLTRVPADRLVLLHTNSSYPAPVEELNLRSLQTLRQQYGVLVGYSGHEVGLFTTLLAIPLGACVIERHITIDRDMWGSDQSASVAPKGLYKLVEEIRTAELALGDGVKRVYPGEVKARAKLQRAVVSRPKGKVGVIVQARVGSSRLPNKVLADLAGKPMLRRITDRLAQCQQVDTVVVAIPDSAANDALAEMMRAAGVNVFRGSEGDVLERHLRAAEAFGIDYIVRVPSDNPVIMASEIDRIIQFYLATAYDYCSNLSELQGNGYPDGLGAEVFSRESLAQVAATAQNTIYREHPHRYYLDHLSVGTLMCPIDFAYPSLRLDVNTPEDLAYIQRIYNDLAPVKEFFDIFDIIAWHRAHEPEKLIPPSVEHFKAPLPLPGAAS